MEKKFTIAAGAMLAGLITLVLLFIRLGVADGLIQDPVSRNDSARPAETGQPAEGRASSDPQRLMIPRWFLTTLTLDGETIAVPEGSVSMQFKDDGSANGSGGCNSFFGEYKAGADGSMQFGPLGATEMFCDNKMDLENAYFQALSKVTRFKTENWKLFLSSEDGKTALVFSMPPK